MEMENRRYQANLFLATELNHIYLLFSNKCLLQD